MTVSKTDGVKTDNVSTFMQPDKRPMEKPSFLTTTLVATTKIAKALKEARENIKAEPKREPSPKRAPTPPKSAPLSPVVAQTPTVAPRSPSPSPTPKLPACDITRQAQPSNPFLASREIYAKPTSKYDPVKEAEALEKGAPKPKKAIAPTAPKPFLTFDSFTDQISRVPALPGAQGVDNAHEYDHGIEMEPTTRSSLGKLEAVFQTNAPMAKSNSIGKSLALGYKASTGAEGRVGNEFSQRHTFATSIAATLSAPVSSMANMIYKPIRFVIHIVQALAFLFAGSGRKAIYKFGQAVGDVKSLVVEPARLVYSMVTHFFGIFIPAIARHKPCGFVASLLGIHSPDAAHENNVKANPNLRA